MPALAMQSASMTWRGCLPGSAIRLWHSSNTTWAAARASRTRGGEAIVGHVVWLLPLCFLLTANAAPPDVSRGDRRPRAYQLLRRLLHLQPQRTYAFLSLLRPRPERDGAESRGLAAAIGGDSGRM